MVMNTATTILLTYVFPSVGVLISCSFSLSPIPRSVGYVCMYVCMYVCTRANDQRLISRIPASILTHLSIHPSIYPSIRVMQIGKEGKLGTYDPIPPCINLASSK